MKDWSTGAAQISHLEPFADGEEPWMFYAAVSSYETGNVDTSRSLLKRARPKLIYLVPTFQNPKGTTLALERREQLARLAADHGVAVLEDDPYGELRYSGADLPAVAALDRRAPIIYLSTFSKTLAPGLRIGWVVAAEETIRALTVAKQACDLHTGTLAQRAAARSHSRRQSIPRQ